MKLEVLWLVFSGYRVESRQLAAQVDAEDDDDRLPVASLPEKIPDADGRLNMRRLTFHLLQLGPHRLGTSSQSEQGCGTVTLELATGTLPD